MKRKTSAHLVAAILASLIFSQIPIHSNVHAEKVLAREEIVEMISEENTFLLNRFIVKFKDSTSEQQIQSTVNGKNALAVQSLQKSDKNQDKFRTIMLENQEKTPSMNISNKNPELSADEKQKMLEELESKLLAYSLDENVEYVQPVYGYKLAAWQSLSDKDNPVPDWNYTNHWYYDKAKTREMWQDQGCAGTPQGADCGGSSSVVVAVIDTGLACEDRNSSFYDNNGDQSDFDIAPEFEASGGFNLYHNAAETNCTNGVDDDGNGYIDDCHGYNAYEDWVCSVYAVSPKPSCTSAEESEAGHPNDDFGHGTYVTGLIASNVDNAEDPPGSGFGTSVSPAFNVTIMPIKASERITNATEPHVGPLFWNDDLCNALDYARLNNADVINMSLGGDSYDPMLESCVNNAYNAGITIVAASGNDSTEGSMQSVDYPAAYSNVIAVGASDSGDNRAHYSNGGSNLDLVAAAGDGNPINYTYQQSLTCFTTTSCHLDPTTSYKTFSAQEGGGTSYASPQVAAGAALIKSRMSDLTPNNVKTILTSTATDIGSSGKDNATGHGILNLEGLWNRGYFYPSNVWHYNTSWAGYKTKFMTAGDFDNDGDDDIAAMYDYGGDRMRLWVFKSDGNGTFSPEIWHYNTSWAGYKTKFMTTGDFDNDGDDDIAAMYDYGGDRMRLWVFKSDGNGTFSPEIWHYNTSWAGSKTKFMTAGDFDNDGDDDIATMYDYGGDRMRLWVFKSDGSSTFSPEIWHYNTSWAGSKTKFMTAGDFDHDGNDDIAAMYDYGSDRMRLWTFKSDGSSTFSPEIWHYNTSWAGSKTKFMTAGGFDSADGRDIATMYDYGSDRMRLWTFKSDGSSTFSPEIWHYNTSWAGSKTKFMTAGDFNNDGDSDIAAMYDYGSDRMRLWIFENPEDPPT